MKPAEPKILYLVTEDWVFCTHRLPLARAALARGYEVVVLTRVQEHGERIRAAGLRLIPIKLRRRSINPFKEIMAICELVRIYVREKPDLVHHVALKPVLYGSIAARIAGVKAQVNALIGLGYVFIAEGLRVALIRKIVMLFFRLAFAHKNSRVIFQNPEDLQIFVDRGVVSRDKSVLIRGSGVDIEYLTPAPAPAGEPKVVLASRMLWDKGIGELVQAARILKQQGVPGRVVLAGRIDLENPAAITEKELVGWHEEGVITWLGYQNDVRDLLQQCHIAVLPSYREGVPKSLLEAAAVGLPLVATDVPGCREVVRQGVNGFLVPVKSPEALAASLAVLLQDRELRQRLGRASREIVEREFSVKLVVRETLALYKGLLR